MVCTQCMGRKTVSSLGGIYKTCSNCNGIGHVVSNDINSKPIVNTISNDIKPIIRKAGRPKKV